MQRIAALIFAAIVPALLPSSLAAQDSSSSPSAAPAAAPHEKVQVFVGVAYEQPAISVVEQPVYCPVQGQVCSPPGTIFKNREGMKGWEVAVGHHFSSNFALVADATGVYGKGTTGFPTDAKAHQYAFLGGPEFSHNGRHFQPYVHGLFGAAHQTVGNSGNSFFVTFPVDKWGFAAAIGGGIDIKLASKFSIRLIQGDYLLTRFGGKFQSQPRISAGIVVRF